MKKLFGAAAAVILMAMLFSPPAEARCSWNGYGMHRTHHYRHHYRHHRWHAHHWWHPYRTYSWWRPRYYYPLY